MASFPVKIVLTAFDKISAPVRKAAAAFKPLNEAIRKTNSLFQIMQTKTKGLRDSLGKVGRGMQSIGRRIMAGVTAPVVGFAALSIKAFADFDNQMRMVKNSLDETSFGAVSLGEGFAGMKAEALDILKTMPVGMAEMNKALFDTVSAGIDASKAIGVVKVSAKLAVAGVTDIATATDGMTSALNSFRLSAGDAEKVGAKFFVAQKYGKTTIEELSQHIGKVSGLAYNAGVSLEEMLASVSAATLGGIKTNEAFTSLKAVLAGVIKPTADAKAAAKALGIEFNSTALRSKGFTAFMGDIIKNSKRIGVEPSLAFEKLFGSTEALNFAMTVGGSQLDKYKMILGELKDETKVVASFQAAYNEQVSSLSNKLAIAKNRLQAAAVTLGEKLAPTVAMLTEKLAVLIEWFSAHPTIAKFAIAVAVAAAALGPIIYVLGSFIAMVPAIMTGIALLKAGFLAFGPAMVSFLAMIKGAFVALGVAIAANPVLFAIGAAVAGLIVAGILIYKNWDKVKVFLIKAWARIAGAFKRHWDLIAVILSGGLLLGPVMIIKNWDKVKKFFSDLWRDVKNIFASGFSWESFKNIFFTMIDGIKGVFNSLFDWVSEKFSAISGLVPDWIKNKISGVGETPLGPTYPAGFGASRTLTTESMETSEQKLIVDFKNLPSGVRVKPEGTKLDKLDLKLGYRGAAAY